MVAAACLQVEGVQGREGGAGAGDQQVVDRGGQGVEEPLEPVEVGGVEGGDAGPELQADPVQAVGVAGGEDQVGALGAGQPGRLQPDAGAAPDHEHGLAEQVPLGPGGRGGGVGVHAASLSWASPPHVPPVGRPPCSLHRKYLPAAPVAMKPSVLQLERQLDLGLGRGRHVARDHLSACAQIPTRATGDRQREVQRPVDDRALGCDLSTGED